MTVLPILAGCGTTREVVDKGAEANDAALNAAEFVICRGASIGSIRRKYSSPELSAVWQDICKENDAFELVSEDESIPPVSP